MVQSRDNRTLAFKTLQHTKGSKEAWHYQALKYMANKVLTRDWIERISGKKPKHLVVKGVTTTDSTCPLCLLTGQNKVQTKEHVWKGECVGTQDIAILSKQDIIQKCSEYQLDQTLHL